MNFLRILAAILLFPLSSFGQVPIYNINICHGPSNDLLCISNKDFVLHFNRSKFTGFETTDKCVIYDEINKLFTIRNNWPKATTDSIFILQLIDHRPVVKSSERIIWLDTVNLSRYKMPEASIVTFGNFAFYLEYSGNWLSEILFDSGNQRYSLKLYGNSTNLFWNMRAVHNINTFIISYDSGLPDLISINNVDEGSEVAIYTNKKPDVFRKAEISKVDKDGSQISGTVYQIEYNRSGIADAKRSTFSVSTCGCN